MRYLTIGILTLGLLVGCAGSEQDSQNSDAGNASTNKAEVVIPASLAPFGDGYPNAGDSCRRLGESALTADWLDHSADLVGCPDAESAAAVGGEQLAVIEGVIIKSIPANQTTAGQPVEELPDELVAGTDYHATAQLSCSADGGKTTIMCDSGVKRAQSADETTRVEITMPDGMKRVILFKGTQAIGTDDSANDAFKATRKADDTMIEFGLERYTIPDALVAGG